MIVFGLALREFIGCPKSANDVYVVRKINLRRKLVSANIIALSEALFSLKDAPIKLMIIRKASYPATRIHVPL